MGIGKFVLQMLKYNFIVPPLFLLQKDECYPVFEIVRMALAITAIAIALPNPMHSSLTLSNARGRGAFCTRRRTHCLKITRFSLTDGSALFQAAHYTEVAKRCLLVNKWDSRPYLADYY